MSTVKNDNIAKLQEGTGTCLLGTPEYQSWLQGETKTIFCVGDVGSGKTVLASQVIDTLLQELGHKDNPVLYFFAEMPTQQAEEQTPASILANFLRRETVLRGQGLSIYSRHCNCGQEYKYGH